MSENEMMDTMKKWVDESHEQVMALVLATGAGLTLGYSSLYDRLYPIYGSDAKMMIGVGTVGLLTLGAGGIYTIGKRAGQIQEPTVIPQIPQEEIREVVARNNDVEVEDEAVVVEDDVVEEVESSLEVDRKPFDNEMNELKKADHFLVFATTGAGKTVVVNEFLRGLDDTSKYICLDGKPEGKNEYKWAEAHTIVNDPNLFAKTLTSVVELMHKRQEKSHIENPNLYVVIDEASLLREDSVEPLKTLISQSRSSNIKVILMSQSVSVKQNDFLDGLTELFNTLPTVSLRFNDNKQRIMSYARISSGKIKPVGKEVLIPQLPVPWIIDRPFEDDSKEFDFGVPENKGGTVVILDDKQSKPILEEPQTELTVEAITQFAMMLSQKTGVNLDSVVDEYVSGIYEEDDSNVVEEALSPMLTARSEIDENKYNFKPSEISEPKNPPLGVTVNIIKNSDLSDSGMPPIGDTIITNGDVMAIRYLNTLSENLPDKDKIGRKAMSHYIWGTNSRFHYQVLTDILGDK